MLTRGEIETGIAAVDARLKALDVEVTEKSIAAIRGDANADARLFDINSDIAREKAKRAALVASLDEIDVIEARDEIAAEKTRRAQHMHEAREHARRVIATAAKVDALVAEFKAAIDVLGKAEAATWKSLRQAEANVSKDVTGRTNIVQHGRDRMSLALKGLDSFANNKPRSVADFARCGWAAIVDQGDEG